MESLKIALATDWFPPRIGGVETHVYELAKRLQEKGHEVTVITSRENGILDDNDLDIRYLPVSNKGFGLDVYFRGARLINEIFKRERFDVVHGHSFFAALSLAAVNVASGVRGYPSIVTFHTVPPTYSYRYPHAPLLRKALQKVTGFISVSSYIWDRIVRLLDWTWWRRPIWVIPDAIDPDYWRPPEVDRGEIRDELGMDLDAVSVITTSRLAIRKRVTAVPEVARHVCSQRDDVRFYVLGDGVDRSRIQLLIKRYKLDNCVHLLGAVPRNRVLPYLQASDIYFDPTKAEAFGIALLEAQSVGLPGLGYIDSGVRDIVRNGYNGFLYVNTRDTVEYINLLADSPALRRRMGKHAREIASSVFSWSTVLPLIEHAYLAVIDRYEFIPFRGYEVYMAWKGKRLR